MDKNTRLLLMYSKLSQGEKINKEVFCAETNYSKRSFDRDIKDIRIFLSEAHSIQRLLYNSHQKVYYIEDSYRSYLDTTEYFFIEKVLLDTAILRKDEFNILMSNLVSLTESHNKLSRHLNKEVKSYEEPLHKKSLLKMHKDLQTIIDDKAVIEINYIKADTSKVKHTVIPCAVKCDLGYMYLIAFIQNKQHKYPAYFRLDRIYSFTSIRSQFEKEQEMVSECLQKYLKGIIQMNGGNFLKVTLYCNPLFYSYVHDKFKDLKIVEENSDTIIIQLKAFEDGFIKWILAQPPNMITVKEPIELIQKIVDEVNKISNTYMEVLSDGKKN